MNSTAARSIKVSFWLFSLAAVGLALNLGLGLNRQEPAKPLIQQEKAPSTQPAARSSVPPFSHYAALAGSQVFGPAGQGEAKPAVVELNLPKVAGYRLIGLMTGSRQHALAVVEDTATGRQRIAGIGEDPGPGKLVAVFADRIVVDSGGKRRQLVMSDRTKEEISGVITLRQEGSSTGDRTKTSPLKDASRQNPRNMISAPVGGALGAHRGIGKKHLGTRAGRAANPEFSSTRETSGAKGLD